MNNNVNPRIRDAWKSLVDADTTERVPAFTNLVEKLDYSVMTKEISIVNASYSVCGAIMFDELDAVPELEQAISLACQLELPPNIRDQEYDEVATWRKIVELTQDVALGRRSGITPSIRLTAVRRDNKNRVTATMGGLVTMKLGKVRIMFGNTAIKKLIEDLAKKLPHTDDTRAHLTQLAAQLEGLSFDGFTLIASVVEHRCGDRHSEFHSEKAFCGSAGPNELKHLEALVVELSDEELA
ncbi:MAG: hypothetical protein QG658_590 [Patescibacteria group bacterium]|jgi:hypothetical protein|nr:hypothetical protein [Patescibacteria group bacterium]